MPHLYSSSGTGSFLQGELDYLKKRAMSGTATNNREQKDLDLEFTRLNLQLELCLLRNDVMTINLTLDAPSSQVMVDIREELTRGKLITAQRLDDLLKELAKIR